MSADVPALLRRVFQLEGERLLAMARLGREPGADDALRLVDETFGGAVAALDARGVAYPVHAVARRYELSQLEYVVLQLALMPWHGEGAARQLTSILGDPADVARLSHAWLIVPPHTDDWALARASFEDLPVITERLVLLTPPDAEDPDVVLAPSMVELLGLSPR